MCSNKHVQKHYQSTVPCTTQSVPPVGPNINILVITVSVQNTPKGMNV